jgi:putative SOS response-associated peptidase YedK
MCGRYTLTTPAGILAEVFRLTDVPDLGPRYNVAPTQLVPAVRASQGGEPTFEHTSRELAQLRWGLVPFFAKDISIGVRMINSRGETAPDKPSFREPFRKRRCLLPASGFLEWKSEGGVKQPYHFRRSDGEPLALAGLWDRWRGKEGEIVESCTILTTDPSELCSTFHDRMPVILSEEDHDLWLDPGVEDVSQLRPLLVPYEGELVAEAVSRRVNNAKNDDAACLEAVGG